MGSTCVARHAGMKHAVRATTHSRTETVENVSTSVDVSVAPGVVLLHLSADYERVIESTASGATDRLGMCHGTRSSSRIGSYLTGVSRYSSSARFPRR